MSADEPTDPIEVGRDGRGSWPFPPAPGCGCMVQTAASAAPGETSACTISLHGVRGGAGTSTVAAVLALTGRALVRTELITTEPRLAAALLGIAHPDTTPAEILPNLTLSEEPTGRAELQLVDGGSAAGGAPLEDQPGTRHIAVLRGPCYLALRTLMDQEHEYDGIVLLAEPGRALTERDVTDVTGLEIVAVVPVTPAVARSIDAGLLVSRLPSRREFRRLQRWLTRQLDPFPARPVRPEAGAPSNPQMNGTDLPVALCATGGHWEHLRRRAGGGRARPRRVDYQDRETWPGNEAPDRRPSGRPARVQQVEVSALRRQGS